MIEQHHGKPAMVAIPRAVFGVMQGFKYQRHFGRGTDYALEFTARVGEASLGGVDLVEFDGRTLRGRQATADEFRPGRAQRGAARTWPRPAFFAS